MLGATGMTVIMQLTSSLLVCIGVQILWNGASALLVSLPCICAERGERRRNFQAEDVAERLRNTEDTKGVTLHWSRLVPENEDLPLLPPRLFHDAADLTRTD